jgi:23S rRNA pseudouridine2605 synthase
MVPSPASNTPVDPPSESHRPIRLQKILAAAGLGSRRECEELILAGRVEVDRQVVTELGAKADPQTQQVRVDGVNLPRIRPVYFMLNKPMGVVSTNRDPSGRPRVIDLVPYPGRLFTVGRLDMSSEGLILVTNDGDLADRLTHPKYGVEKTYHVEVAGTLEHKQLEQMRKGVHLAEGFARVVSVRVLKQFKQSTRLEIVLAEGRNREIRRILARIGHKVQRLKRVAIGPLKLADLPVGVARPLDPSELKDLKRAAQGAPPRKRPGKRKPAKKPRTKSGPAARTVIGGDQLAKRPAAGKVTGRKLGGPKPAGAGPRGLKPAAAAKGGKSRRPGTGRPAGGKPQRAGKPGRRKP